MSDQVSIPFIAGQWSLRAACTLNRRETNEFQSPSLRGSGRFHPSVEVRRASSPVSIPFIAGQWSLQQFIPARTFFFFLFQSPSLRGSGRFGAPTGRLRPPGRGFQSPSLRGSGRFELGRDARRRERDLFQSPSLRGSGRFKNRDRPPPHGGGVSIPFIAGQWSLPTGPPGPCWRR